MDDRHSRKLHPLRARSGELLALTSFLLRDRPQLVVVSGQRRVGKTFLVQHALDRLPADIVTVYFEATQAGEAAELARFHQILIAAVGPDVLPPGPSPTSWQQALSLAAFAARHHPLVVAIDEATYLMASSPGFASMVQAVWDSLTIQHNAPRLGLVLTGSAVGIVEDALSTGGALYRNWLAGIHHRVGVVR